MTPHLFPTSMEMEFSKLMVALNFWLWEAEGSGVFILF